MRELLIQTWQFNSCEQMCFLEEGEREESHTLDLEKFINSGMDSVMSPERTCLQEQRESTGLCGAMEAKGDRYSEMEGKTIVFDPEPSGDQAQAEGSLKGVQKKPKQYVLMQSFNL